MNRHNCQIIPASQWISIGYTEDHAQKMEKLQNDMKKYCEEDDTTIVELKGVENGEQIYPDISWLLPHWMELFNALHGRTSVEKIKISRIKLPVLVLDTLFPTLQSLNLKQLGLYATEIGSEGLLLLSTYLKENSSLKCVVIGGDAIDDLSVATSLSDAVKNHPTLEQVSFINCALTSTDILGKLLEGCVTIKSVKIEGCRGIESEAVALISDFI